MKSHFKYVVHMSTGKKLKFWCKDIPAADYLGKQLEEARAACEMWHPVRQDTCDKSRRSTYLINPDYVAWTDTKFVEGGKND